MYTKNYPKGAFHETAGNSIGISQASLAMLPNWKLRFESCQSQFAPISPKIDALKFDYSAFDDAPAVVPLGIWAFSSLTRAVEGSGKGGAFRLESFRFNTIIMGD